MVKRRATKRNTQRQDTLAFAIEDALEIGRYVSWDAGFSFVSSLLPVTEEIGKLVDSDPVRAAGLYEIFIAGCNEKVEDVDDSDGEFGIFAAGLFRGWITARQAADADREETSKLLLAWMDDDPYGFCNDLAIEAVGVLDRTGLESFEREVRARLDAALGERPTGSSARDYGTDRWSEILKAIYAQLRNIRKYVEVATRTGLTRDDCATIGALFQTKRKPNDALSWVERGLKIENRSGCESSAGHKLSEMRRALLAKLGRRGEALDSAWEEFQTQPGETTYKELRRYVPKAERGAWHEKAMDAAEGGDLASLIKLWLSANEIGRLAERLDRTSDSQIQRLSHYVTEPAAERLAPAHPGVAARVFGALCVRIIDAGKSKYYCEALSNLEKARTCYQQAGLDAEWTALTAGIRQAHYRKTGFMPGFEKIVAGKGPRVEPSFLERTRGHWARRAKA